MHSSTNTMSHSNNNPSISSPQSPFDVGSNSSTGLAPSTHFPYSPFAGYNQFMFPYVSPSSFFAPAAIAPKKTAKGKNKRKTHKKRRYQPPEPASYEDEIGTECKHFLPVVITLVLRFR